MVALLILVLWPVLELFVAIKVADAIGLLLTILLLVVTWPLGAWVLRSQGRAAWQRLTTAVNEGRPPGRAVLDGALVVAGAVLLMIPGFITDAIAIALLLPPTRALLRIVLARNLQSRFVAQTVQFTQRHHDVDSTAHDVEPPRLQH